MANIRNKQAKQTKKTPLSLFPRKLGLTLLNLGFCLSIPTMLVAKALAAERILVNYKPLEFSISVDSIETYVRTGKLTGELVAYTDYLNEEQLEQLRTALVVRADITPIAISQFLYSPQGEAILERVSQIVKTEARQPGFYAIRSALILAAADKEGLTPLNFLRKFPVDGIRIDSNRGFEILEQLNNVIEETEQAIATLQNTATIEASIPDSPDVSTLPDLSQPGNVPFTKESFVLNDRKRNREFPVDFYLPQQRSRNAQIPVVVISHGLGSDRGTFAYLGRHLASHGYAVAVPEHPGSNADQINALLNGFADQVTPATELLDRPLDIRFLLNHLERSYRKLLNLKEVGIIGQSFGGYTALALAGAEINFQKLRVDCQNFEDDFLNVSLILQCLALQVPNSQGNLRDERIAAAIAINPLTSSVFGQEGLSGIQIPVMIVASGADRVAPALSEQIEPFTWLTTLEKYLVLLQNGTHFSTLGESSEQGGIPIPEQVIGPDPKIGQSYIEALSLAFYHRYIADQLQYQVYLTPGYARKISQSRIPLSLVRSLSLQLSAPQK